MIVGVVSPPVVPVCLVLLLLSAPPVLSVLLAISACSRYESRLG